MGERLQLPLGPESSEAFHTEGETNPCQCLVDCWLIKRTHRCAHFNPQSRGGGSDASYSWTGANTGRPAKAARARVAESLAMTDRRFSCVSASRASSRKLIRDVATREP